MFTITISTVESVVVAELSDLSPRVAKSMFSANTPALLSRLSRVLLPALVYPTRATTGSPRRILEGYQGGGGGVCVCGGGEREGEAGCVWRGG